MSLYAVLLDVMGAVCFTVAASEILIHFRRKGRSYSLSFGVTSLFAAAYCLMCAGQYNVSDPSQSVFWLKMESVFLNLTAVSFLWFISNTTGRVKKPYFLLLCVWFIGGAAVQILGFGDLTWIASRPYVKEIPLLFGARIVYREVEAGPITLIQSVVGLLLFVYIFWILVGHYKAGHTREARSLLLVVGIACAAIMNDFAVSFNLYAFLYLSEYAWLAVIFFVGFERSNQVLESVAMKGALEESEEKFRTLIEQSSEAVILADESGVIIEYNRAAEALTGVPAKDALCRRVSDVMSRLEPGGSAGEGSRSLDALFGHMADAGSERATERRVEGELRRPDGTRRYFRQNIFPIRTKNGYRWGSIAHDITELKKSHDELVASLQEKNVLLKEIHHRVKNNLQIVSSLLYLQESGAEDPKYKAIIHDSRNQINSMALIHEDLYRSDDFRNIRFGEYIRKLSRRLMSTLSAAGQIALTLTLDDISLTIDKAIPCGLLLNELCTNALKYAFPTGLVTPGPELRIELHEREDGFVEISVADNGIGLPKDFSFRNTQSLGMQIVTSLARQLQGTVRVESERGTCFKVSFPRSGPARQAAP